MVLPYDGHSASLMFLPHHGAENAGVSPRFIGSSGGCEKLFQVAYHFSRQPRYRFKHAKDDPGYADFRVYVLLDQFDRFRAAFRVPATQGSVAGVEL